MTNTKALAFLKRAPTTEHTPFKNETPSSKKIKNLKTTSNPTTLTFAPNQDMLTRMVSKNQKFKNKGEAFTPPPPPAFDLVSSAAIDYNIGPFRAALVEAFDQIDEQKGAPQGTTLVNVVAQLIAKAEEGNYNALSLLGDRLDGKAPQAVQLSGEGGGPIEFSDMTAFETAKRLAFMFSRGMAAIPDSLQAQLDRRPPQEHGPEDMR